MTSGSGRTGTVTVTAYKPWGTVKGWTTLSGIQTNYTISHLLAEGLHHIPIDVCISSPLQRSYQTCKLCADLHKLPVATDERLLEINHGSWEGVLAPEIAKQYPQEFAQWHTKPHLVQMPDGGESLEDVRKRARAAFDDYATKYTDKTVLVAAHDAVNKAIICDLLGLDMSHFWQIKQDNACTITEQHTGCTIGEVDDCTHFVAATE